MNDFDKSNIHILFNIKDIVSDYIHFENSIKEYITLFDGVDFLRKELLYKDTSKLKGGLDILYVAVRNSLMHYGFIDSAMNITDTGRQFILKLISNGLNGIPDSNIE